MIRDVTEGIFRDMLKRSEDVIVVEWWSPGCSVCKEMVPVYERVAREMDQEAAFVRINTDVFGDLANRNGVVGTPTFMVFCRDGAKGQVVGLTSATALRNTVRDIIRYHTSCPVKRRGGWDMDGYG